VPRLQSAGHHVTVLELGGGPSMPKMAGSVQVVPCGIDQLGHDVVEEYARRFASDVVITLTDAWGLNPEVMKRLNWTPFVPVDHTPVPPAVRNSLTGAKVPIAISRFGVEQLRNAGFAPLYFPHAVDPAVWHPIDRARARQELNIPQETFLVAFVGVNDSCPSRKGIPELLAAWSLFAPEHPDALLYMHTSERGNTHLSPWHGVRIDEITRTFELNERQLTLVNQHEYKTGIPASYLALMANAADVLIIPSRGEGFCVPLIEFQRCGCPVIVTDFSAQAELCFTGWRVEYEPVWSQHNAVHAQPSAVSIHEALCAAYEDRGNELRRTATVEAAREYDIENVMALYGLPTIRTLAEMMLDGVRCG
jgi:glycosyltransferase involved in cell wall biosynthesis